MSQPNPWCLGKCTPPLVCGWHSYCSDYGTHLPLSCPSMGPGHGLDTNPNLSFMSAEPPEDYKFKNKGRGRGAKSRGAEFQSADQLQQTDGLGLGAWQKVDEASCHTEVTCLICRFNRLFSKCFTSRLPKTTLLSLWVRTTLIQAIPTNLCLVPGVCTAGQPHSGP